MSELKDVREELQTLRELNCQLSSVANIVKQYDSDWEECNHDRSIIFQLNGMESHIEDKLCRLMDIITKLENKE